MTVLLQHLILFAAASLMIPPLIIVITMICGKKTGHGICYIALLLCAARLLIPTGWGYTLFSFSDWDKTRLPDNVIIERLEDAEDGYEGNQQPSDNKDAVQDSVADSRTLSASDIVFICWAGSSVLFLAIQLGLTYRSIRRIKKRACEIPPELNRRYHRVAAGMGLKRIPTLVLVKEKTIPHLIGVFSPYVVLGATPLSDVQLELVLQHELQHYKRKDLWGKLFLLICLSVFWWNPSVWWLTFRAQEEMECACDENILSGKDGDERYAYGQTILQVLKSSKRSAVLVSTSFGFARKSTTFYRFRDLLSTHQRKGGKVLLISVVALLILSAALVGCTKGSEQKDIVFYLGSDIDLNLEQLSELSQTLEAPVNTGYSLIGWKVESVANGSSGFAIDFEPVWEPVSCDILYVLRGGFIEEENVTLYNSSLPTPSHPRYTFGGWYTDEAMTDRIYTVPLEPTTVYAKWNEENAASDFVFSENKTGLTLVSYSGSDTEVVIPAYVGAKAVTSIAVEAFSQKTGITSVVIPETVTAIGVNAFRFCYAMTEARLYCRIDYLDNSVFSGCYELKDLYFSGTEEEWDRITKWVPENTEIHFYP